MRILYTWPWLFGWTGFLIAMIPINILGAIAHITRMPTQPLSESLYATNNIACTVVMIACTAHMTRIIHRKLHR
jgi:hypothetical protein